MLRLKVFFVSLTSEVKKTLFWCCESGILHGITSRTVEIIGARNAGYAFTEMVASVTTAKHTDEEKLNKTVSLYLQPAIYST